MNWGMVGAVVAATAYGAATICQAIGVRRIADALPGSSLIDRVRAGHRLPRVAHTGRVVARCPRSGDVVVDHRRALAVTAYAFALERGRTTSVAAITFATETIVPAAVGLLFLGDRVRHHFGPVATIGFVITLAGCIALAARAEPDASASSRVAS